MNRIIIGTTIAESVGIFENVEKCPCSFISPSLKKEIGSSCSKKRGYVLVDVLVLQSKGSSVMA